jgi:membrane protein YdbS with pleckstrin-like domain
MKDIMKMSNNNIQVKASRTSWFMIALTLLFIYLKLTGEILWSWWWVLGPLWIPTAVVLTLIFVTVVLIGVLEKK